MNVVVIGGAGFIGSHLVDRLLAEGHAVDVVDDLSTGSLGHLAEARAAARGDGAELKIHHLDLASAEASTLIGLRRPDVVFHLALFPRGSTSRDPRGADSLTGALGLLDAAVEFGVGKVVVALPATALYGSPPMSGLPVKEGEIIPRGVRGVIARAVFDLLSTYREQEMLEFAALALASVYGPRQNPSGGVVAAFREAAEAGAAPSFFGDGRQTRDFVFIDDVVDALVRAMDRSSGLLINVGTAEQTTIRDLWRLVSGAVGAEPVMEPQRRNELVRFAVSPVRARIHLGWSPWTDLATGVQRSRIGG